MPVFNLELKFDDKGALQAVRQISNVSGAANEATRAINNLGNSAGSNSQALVKMGQKGEGAANAITAAMKSAAKNVLALVGAFAAVNKAMDFMNRGLEFNASLEQSQIGIASLITSMVKLQDSQGNLLEGQEKYNAAQEISRGLMEQIQVLGLQTTADSKSIVEGFQAILAPALQAGMALENIPKFAVQGAQALQTLGVPLNQMRTELDALLTGSVNLSQDILAPKLFSDVKGNLKEYIQGLRDAGKLEEEIFRRLKPYNLALKDTENTWAAISSNLGEALDKLAGDSSLNYTKALKKSLSEINNLIIDTNTGKISKDFENIANLLTDIQDWIGNKIVASTEKLISLAKEFNVFLGSDFGKASLEGLITALELASGALAGFAAAKGLAFGKEKIAPVIASITDYKNKLIEAANADLEVAIAEKRKFEAIMRSAEGQAYMARSESNRVLVLTRQAQLINNVTAAQNRLNVALMAGGAAGAMNALGKGIGSLVNMLGGPFNTALMAAGAGVAFIASRQSEAEKAADLHSSALSKLNEVQKQATEIGKGLADNLGEIAEARRVMAIDDATQAMEKYANAIKLLDFRSADYNDKTGFRAQAEELNELSEAVRTGQASFSDFSNRLAEVYKEMSEAGKQGTELGKRIKEALDLAVKGADLETVLGKLRGEIEGTAEAAKKSVSVYQEQKNAIDDIKAAVDKYNQSEKANVETLEGALQWLNKRNASTEEGKKRSEALAKATDIMAMATLNAAIATAEFNAAAANTALLGDNITEAMISTARQANDLVVELKAARASIEEGMKDPNYGGKSGSGSGGKKGRSGGIGRGGADPAEAAKKWQELKDQLDQLEGKSTGAAASLKKTLDEIAKTGKEAKKSARDIEKLQKAFREATDTKTINELNKELLQLEGNTRAVEEIERKEKTDQFKARLSEIKSLSEDEKNILLGRYEQAVQREVKVNDLQVQVDFMKDLESLGGSYGLTVEKQNELLEYQAALYRDKLPSDMQPYIDQWERLKKLENDKSFMGGLERGVKKFGEQYGDLAANVESFTTQMGSTISSTLSNAFMTGKFSAQDFFSSLVSMAAQAATNQFIGMIFQGLFGAFGSAAGSYNGLNSSAAAGAANTSGYSVNMGTRWSGASAKGNVFSGGNLGDYSGKIVNQPTFFAYGTHFTAYAKGAGLMGEKGPEAILPLARMSNGDLGVQYKLDSGLNTPQSDTANFGRIIAELQSQMREDRQYMGNNMPVINLNIENNANADVQAGQMKQDGNGGFSMDIIISQLEQGMVGRAKQGKSQLQQYQQQAYGFNRAGVIARGKGRN